LRHYGADDPNLAPLLGDELVPVVLVDDVSYVQPPLLAPVTCVTLSQAAAAGLFSLLSIRTGSKGVLVRYSLAITVTNWVLGANNLITAGAVTITPGITTGTPEVLLQTGTAVVAPATTLGVTPLVLAAGEVLDGLFVPGNMHLTGYGFAVNTACTSSIMLQEPVGEVT
jgi:hypothetical protein